MFYSNLFFTQAVLPLTKSPAGFRSGKNKDAALSMWARAID
jgi:hypothetical protein